MKELVTALGITLVVQAVLSMTAVAPAVLAPVAQADIGVEASAVGIFTALVYFSAALSAPLGGTFVARLGAVRVSQFCLLCGGCGFALCALAHPLALAAGALVLGCGYGPITPASSVILAARTPQRVRNFVMSVRQTGVPLGGALAGVLVPVLLLAMHWKTATLAISALCLLCIFALETVREHYDGGQRAVSASTSARPTFVHMMRVVIGHTELRRMAYATFVYGGMQWCLASFLVVFLTETAGVSLINAGFALSAAMVAGVIGRVLWGIVADLIGNARLVLGALGVAMSLSALALSQVSGEWPFVLIMLLSVIYGGTAIGWNGVYVAEIARIAPADQIATATGASLTFTYLGVVVMPFLFWLIVTASGSYAFAYIAAGVVTLVPALSYLRRRSAL
jgi:MFS family permease